MAARLRDAPLRARRSTWRERSHVEAITRHVNGDSAPLVRHLRRHPTDALLLSTAVPTIAFSGVTTMPEESWAIVCLALRRLVRGEPAAAADALARLEAHVWRLGGSDAQREVVEETRLSALLQAGRYDAALRLVDARLDRRRCRRDERFRATVRRG